MTVKTTGFTIKDAFEAKTKRLRNKLGHFLVVDEKPKSMEAVADELRVLSAEDFAVLVEESSSTDELLRLQKYANADITGSLFKNIKITAVKETTPRTRLGVEALRDVDIDLDTVNFAFDRAMKQSHG
ncbi:TPA: hypothetical protein NM870_003482 [Acinetobacter baumannii]|nr:hypothetical protein [Acinetobacter baumannii]